MITYDFAFATLLNFAKGGGSLFDILGFILPQV